MCNKHIHVNPIAGLVQRAHAINVIDINFFLPLFVQKGYLVFIYLFIRNWNNSQINCVDCFTGFDCVVWSIWFAHFVHYVATSSSICIWSMMKSKMLAHNVPQQWQRRLWALACHAICSVHHLFTRNYSFEIVQSTNLIKFNNGLRLSIRIHVLQCTVLMLYLLHLKTNTNKMSICEQRPCRCSRNTCSSQVWLPTFLCNASHHRLQSPQVSFTMSHTSHTSHTLTWIMCVAMPLKWRYWWMDATIHADSTQFTCLNWWS